MAYLARKIVSEFYEIMVRKDWANNSGGGLSIRDTTNNVYWMSTSLEYGLRHDKRNVVHLPYANITADMCAGLLKFLFDEYGANAIIHTHSTNSIVTGEIARGDLKTFSNYDVIKNLNPTGSVDLPIIENVRDIASLEVEIRQAMQRASGVNAVLVRKHGLFVWDVSAAKAVLKCEAFEDLFDIFVNNPNR